MRIPYKQQVVRTVQFIVMCLLLAGCSNPVPPEKSDYIGEWQSKEMYLLILQDGSLRYQRLKGGANTKITGPIKEFQGDNFIVGFAFITTTFEVSTPPYKVGGVWKMVVDGVTLTKTAEDDY